MNHFKELKYNYQKDRLGNTHLVERCLACGSCKRFIPLLQARLIEERIGKIPFELSEKQKKLLPDNGLKLF